MLQSYELDREQSAPDNVVRLGVIQGGLGLVASKHIGFREELLDSPFADCVVLDRGIVIQNSGDEDIFNAESDDPYAGWTTAWFNSNSYRVHITPYRGVGRLAFMGNAIEYDEETDKVWLYNASRDFRVEYGDTMAGTIVEMAEGESAYVHMRRPKF